MEIQEIFNQLFYPINNFLSMFFAVLIALLVERLIKEFEKADILKICKKPTNFLGDVSNFLLWFTISFFIVFLIIIVIILLVVILLALTGYILIN